jgi:hypothetical protein
MYVVVDKNDNAVNGRLAKTELGAWGAVFKRNFGDLEIRLAQYRGLRVKPIEITQLPDDDRS